MRKFKEIFLTVLISMSIVSCGVTDNCKNITMIL